MSDEQLNYAKWQQNAAQLQQILYQSLGDRTFEEFLMDDEVQMDCARIKIAYAKFGERKEPVDKKQDTSQIHWDALEENNDSSQIALLQHSYATLYTEKERKVAGKTLTKLCQLVKKADPNANQLQLAFFFVVFQKAKTDDVGQVPVIRVLRKCVDEGSENNPVDQTWYVDHEDRVYQDWQCYLDNNRLPRMSICYPKNGYYSSEEGGYSKFDAVNLGAVLLDYGKTPATRLSRRIAHIADNVSTGVIIGSLGIGVAALLSAPISAPILLGATVGSGVAAVYGAGRSTATLVDRKIHEQRAIEASAVIRFFTNGQLRPVGNTAVDLFSINVTDPEARLCWIGIGGATFALGAQAATVILQEMATLGYAAGRSAQYTVNGLHAGSLLINGVATGNQAYYIANRLSKGEKVTAFDVMQLSLSVFFFSSSIMTFKTVGSQLNQSKNDSTVLAPSDHHVDAHAAGGAQAVQPTNFVAEQPVAAPSSVPAEPSAISGMPSESSRIIRTLNEIPARELLQRTIGLTKEVTKVAFRDKDREKKELLEQRAALGSSPGQEDNADGKPHIIALTKDMEHSPILLSDQMRAILARDKEFLKLIKHDYCNEKDCQLLEMVMMDAFNVLENKKLIVKLLPIAISLAKLLGCRNAIPEFFQVCNGSAYFIHEKSAKRPAEKLTEELKNPDGKLYKELAEKVEMEFFLSANLEMSVPFEDGKAAQKFYEQYKKTLESYKGTANNPGQFMTDIDNLFTGESSKKRSMITLPLVEHKKTEYDNGIWRAAVYETGQRRIKEVKFIGEVELLNHKPSHNDS